MLEKLVRQNSQHTRLKRECAGGSLQFTTVACSSSMSRVVSVLSGATPCVQVGDAIKTQYGKEISCADLGASGSSCATQRSC